jgi:hypothetical protein
VRLNYLSRTNRRRGVQNGFPKQSLNIILILASNGSYSRGSRNRFPACLLKPYSLFLTHFLLLLTITHPRSPQLTLIHRILLIKQPCSPFQTKPDFVQIRIQVQQLAVTIRLFWAQRPFGVFKYSVSPPSNYNT